jgi:hypothetical protein
VLDTSTREALLGATVVASGPDGRRLVAITGDNGTYCIDTRDADVQVDVYFADVAMQRQVHLGEGLSAATDLLMAAFPVNTVIIRASRPIDQTCVFPVPSIIDRCDLTPAAKGCPRKRHHRSAR